MLASPRRGFICKLAKPAAEATAPLLAAMARLGDVVRDQEQAVKAALLEEALEPVAAREEPPLAARAAAFGIDFAKPARMVVVRSPRGGEASSWPRSRGERIPHLVHSRDGSLTALVQGDVDGVLADPGRRPARRGDRRRPRRWRRSSTPTTRCATPSWRSSAGGRGSGSRTSTSATFMVSEIPPERLDPKVDEILAVLRANPPLHEAVRAYFAHDLDIAATAASLHMHRNSLRYRLARAEQVLGRSLKQPSTIAADPHRAGGRARHRIARQDGGQRAADGAVPGRRRRLRVPRHGALPRARPQGRAGRRPRPAQGDRRRRAGDATSRRTSTASTSGRRRPRTSAPSGWPREAFGAERTFFLTNGATQGNHALCLALAPLGARIVAQRNSHASIVDGLVLSGGIPSFVAPEYDAELGITHCVTPDALERALRDAPDAEAAFLVSPTYYGMAADVAALAEVAHGAGVPLVVDQSWGPHFGFNEELPPTALSQGADAMLTSTHKIAGSLTQSAMLHIGGSGRVDVGAVAARCGCCARRARRRC